MRHFFPLLLAALLLGGCHPDRAIRSMQGMAFGTLYEILYVGEEDLRTAESIDSLLAVSNQTFSIFDPNSLLSRLNRNETDSLDETLGRVIRQALELSRQTDGAFDITVAPLVDAWGFGPEKRKAPTSAEIDSLLAFTGYGRIRADEARLHKEDARIRLNLNAIAKGFIVDQVAELVGKRHPDFLVNIGGEIVCGGKRPNGSPWSIGIQLPTDDSLSDNGYCHSFHLPEGMAVATSGDYRRYHTDSLGRRFSHIINPKTGFSETSDILSATVIAGDCMTADALATACMVLGSEKSLQLLAAHPEWAACLICHEKGRWKVLATPNFPAEIEK